MRKMRNWSLKGKEIFIGLEDSKRSWKLCVRCGEEIVDETRMPTKYAVLLSYLRNRYPKCRISLMYEAGFGGFWLHDLLERDGIKCVVTPANKVTQAKVNKVKTDRVDARRLARNLQVGDYVECRVPDIERRRDRQLVRTLSQVQKQLTANRNRIRKFLDFHGLNGDLPAGAWKPSRYKLLRNLKLDSALQFCLDVYLRIVDQLEALQAELKAQLKELTVKERYRESVSLKQSCPGVGWLSAIRFTLEWGEMLHFENGKRLASFAGLTSSEYSTGERVHKGRITRQGNGQVRGWLIQCAWCAIKYDPALLHKYEKVRYNSGSKKKAIVAVARKLAVRMRAVELSRQAYVCGVVK